MIDCIPDKTGVCQRCRKPFPAIAPTARRNCYLPHERPQAPSPPPAEGPGTELHQLLLEMGADEQHCTLCATHVVEMNVWGVTGCHQHRATIAGWLRDSAFRHPIEAGAMANTLRKQPWFNRWSPFLSIVDEAIRRATANERKPR